MKTFMNMLKDESGATAIEYALIAALISVIAIIAMRRLGGNVSNTFNNVANQLGNA